MRKWLLGPMISAGVIGATLGVSAFALTNGPADSHQETFRQLELYAQILGRVEADYVVPIDEKKAIEASINGMLSSLDPHSSYMNAEDYQTFLVQMSGEYGGLGIEVTSEDGFVKVVSPMDDTPASRAGIESGDYLTAIDGMSIIGLPLNDAVDQMRGEPGEDITLTIVREGVEPFEKTLTREKIRPASVRSHAEGDIGYIRISAFNELTSDSFDKAYSKLKSEIGGMKGLVIDLRDNPGGALEQAIEISSRFLDGGEVVSVRGRRPEDEARYHARRSGKRVTPDMPVAVLINNGSASAAEIVAGALQDRGRAKVIGLTSFGKGSVQSVIALGPGKGAIRLTTSRYYTPAGKSIQGAGIEPDFEVAPVRLSDEDIERLKRRAAQFSEASLPNALENDQGVERRPPHVPADMPPEGYEGDDYQLQRALNLLKSGKI